MSLLILSSLSPSSSLFEEPLLAQSFLSLPPSISYRGRFGFGPSSVADSMIVVNTPSQDLVLTNFAYCSSMDLDKYAAPGSKNVLVLVLVGYSLDAVLISQLQKKFIDQLISVKLPAAKFSIIKSSTFRS
ncbi:unnamed protein product [Musa acuminata subsp. burmannicoides]